MLLSNNTDLTNIDKIRLAIHILENLQFTTDYDIEKFIKLLKEVLGQLDPNYNKTITNFAVYKNLLLMSAIYMELSLIEKQKFSVEMLFNIFETNFNNEEINTKINKRLDVYDYCYFLDIL